MSNRGLNSNVPRQDSTATSSSVMLSGMRREKEAPVGLDIGDYSTNPGKVSGRLGYSTALVCLFFGEQRLTGFDATAAGFGADAAMFHLRSVLLAFRAATLARFNAGAQLGAS